VHQLTVPDTRPSTPADASVRGQPQISLLVDGVGVDTQMSAIEHALLAVLAADCGDILAAEEHIARAQHRTRTTARRERQIVEIAALAVTGQALRAAGLSLEHTKEFPSDAELLTALRRPKAVGM
jgi:hypothetical protein